MKNPNSQSGHNKSFYVFALKEGKEIQKNLLDYKLLLLQVGDAIHIPSPNKSIPSFQLFVRNSPYAKFE